MQIDVWYRFASSLCHLKSTFNNYRFGFLDGFWKASFKSLICWDSSSDVNDPSPCLFEYMKTQKISSNHFQMKMLIIDVLLQRETCPFWWIWINSLVLSLTDDLVKSEMSKWTVIYFKTFRNKYWFFVTIMEFLTVFLPLNCLSFCKQ